MQPVLDALEKADKTMFKKSISYFMKTFGTRLPCNRFAMGNLVEKLIIDILRKEGFNVKSTANAIRYDCDIENFGGISIKYSSGGDITLHNSKSSLNKDTIMVNTLLVTPTEWWFLSPTVIKGHGIDLDAYLKNNGDSLSLKHSIFKELRKYDYDLMFTFNLELNKKDCLDKEIGDIVADYVLSQVHAEE